MKIYCLEVEDEIDTNDLEWVINILADNLDEEANGNSNTFTFKDKRGKEQYLLIKVSSNKDDIVNVHSE